MSTRTKIRPKKQSLLLFQFAALLGKPSFGFRAQIVGIFGTKFMTLLEEILCFFFQKKNGKFSITEFTEGINRPKHLLHKTFWRANQKDFKIKTVESVM